MPNKNYNWVIGCVTLMLTLAVLFGGQFLWNKYAVANPVNRMFQNIDGVESVSISRLNEQSKNNETVKIYIKLNHVDNLQNLYEEITDGLNQVGGGKKYDIVIRDTRTPELEQFYYSIHYDIQEAIFTGNFATMAERIQAKAGSAQVKTQIYVGNKNIYVQMTKGADGMYVVVPRDSGNRGVK
ncbi:hypothetical protein SCACP_23480 [Sporomusa carbonis]|uniref:hypothetical protein n=1 Tax=Sporomusa carbonis TaxID=3076075 RepID=UPI003A76FAE7